MTHRLHHLDALRAFAMLLGVGLHCALSLTGSPWLVTDAARSPAMAAFVEVIHGFRMPLFFVVSGYFTMLLYRRRGLSSLVGQRFRRVAVPFCVGLVTVVPLLNLATVYAFDTAPKRGRTAGGSPLVEAVKGKDADQVGRLLAAGAEPSALDPESGVPPLGWAALVGDAESAKLLLDAGADANGKDRTGYRPLHSAAFLGRSAVAALLIERGADVDAKGPAGDTARESAAADQLTTRYLAGLMKVTVGPWAEVTAGRKECVALIDAKRQAAPDPLAGYRKTLDGWRSDYRNWLFAGRWSVRLNAFGANTHLVLAPQFGHLWFLWFLVLFVAAFAALAGVLRWLPRVAVSPWLVAPLVLGPQVFMGMMGGGPGPDTPLGLLPPPHLLLYYAVFFAFGVLLHDRGAERFGRWWRLWLPLAAGGYTLARHWHDDPLRSAGPQTVYTWAMIAGLFGLFRVALPAERGWVRYLSDSSYWLYLAHLPLAVFLQAVVRDWQGPAWLKVLGLCVAVTASLLAVYQLAVRHTAIGELLNGPRPEPGVAKTG